MQGREYRAGDPVYGKSEREAAMGINWMTRKELSQAIPPAFTKYIGKFLMEAVSRQSADNAQLHPDIGVGAHDGTRAQVT